MTLVVGVVMDVDLAVGTAVEVQAMVVSKTNLRLTKSLGFMPTSTAQWM
jgi:hypothetical protein